MTPAQRRDAELMAAQGETPERIAAHFGVTVDDLKPGRRGSRKD